jgi:hypothetical protein
MSKPAWKTLTAFVRRWVDRLQSAVVTGAAALLIVYLVPPVRKWMETRGYLNAELVVAVVGLALAVVLRSLLELEKKVDALTSSQTQTLVTGGVARVYQQLEEICDSYARRRWSTTPRARTLEVLGLTLYTAWPKIRGFLEDARYVRWKIDLYGLDPDFVRGRPETFPGKWATDVETRLAEIRQFAEERADDLWERRIALGLKTYAHFPALHGFLIERSDLVYAVSQWGRETLEDPYQFYEYFPAADSSPRAEEHRGRFKNWLDRAARTGRDRLGGT